MPVSFDDTRTAFASQSDVDLRHSYWLFRLVGRPAFVSAGKVLTSIALALHVPIKWMIKPTIFRHFCGGETVEESRKKVEALSRFGIKSILDYSVEGKANEEDFEKCLEEILAGIKEGAGNRNIGFSVFKPTGIGRFGLLEKVSGLPSVSSGGKLTENEKGLSSAEKKEFERVVTRFNRICKAAHDSGVPVFVDAEETWIQAAVDMLVNDMMQVYNKEKPIVYNTFQMYRKDRLEYLAHCLALAEQNKYFLGAKLVRGAYMEKERMRAEKMGYPSPINGSKEVTDSHYNDALRLCVEHIDRISFCCASHNEQSSMLLISLMLERNIPNNHPHICFSQLLGMSDHISYNLAAAGYNVSKYVPYGPVRDVIPYLIRRAQENTSVKGQTGRELSLITAEIKRRKGNVRSGS